MRLKLENKLVKCDKMNKDSGGRNHENWNWNRPCSD